jgi:hypothetical protein
MNTTHEVTNADIEALQTEAAEQGDSWQVSLCIRALNGDASAAAECERVIRNARGQS